MNNIKWIRGSLALIVFTYFVFENISYFKDRKENDFYKLNYPLAKKYEEQINSLKKDLFVLAPHLQSRRCEDINYGPKKTYFLMKRIYEYRSQYRFLSYFYQLDPTAEKQLLNLEKEMSQLEEGSAWLQNCIMTYSLEKEMEFSKDDFERNWYARLLKIAKKNNKRSVYDLEYDQEDMDTFTDLADLFFNREGLSGSEARILQFAYSIWASAYDSHNSRESTLKNKKYQIYYDNPHNLSFIHWLRAKSKSWIKNDSILLHLDSHTDLRKISLVSKDPRFHGFTIIEIAKLLEIIERGGVDEHRRVAFNYLNKLKLNSNDKKIKTIAQLQYLITNTSSKRLKSVLYEVSNLENFQEDFYAKLKEILSYNEDELALKKRVIKEIKSIPVIHENVRRRLLIWISQNDINEITNSLYTLINYVTPHIANPIVPAVATGIADTVIMLMPSWVSRVPDMSKKKYFIKPELFTLNKDFVLYNNLADHISVGLDGDEETNIPYLTSWSPMQPIEKNTNRITHKSFKYASMNLFDESSKEKSLAITNQQSISFINSEIRRTGKDLIMGIDLDMFATNSSRGGNHVEPLSYERNYLFNNISSNEFERIKKRLDSFKELLSKLDKKPKLISLADSVALWRSHPSENLGSFIGGNFTPPSLIFLINFRVRKIINELYNDK